MVMYWLSVGAQPSDPVQRLLFRSGLLPPPPMVAMGRKGGPRDTRPVDPMTGRYVDAEKKPVNDNQPKEELKEEDDAEDKSPWIDPIMSNDKDNFNVSDLTAALKEEDRAGLVNALKNKLQNLAGQHSDVLENLTPKIRRRVEVLREIQGKHDEIETKFREERAALEAKYQKLYQPLYTKRYEIVNGATEVEGAPEDTKMDQGEEKAAEEKGVPSFWLTALKNNDVISEEITERDEGALMYLKDIKWCKIEEPKGFKLEFFFDQNPYFKNTLLTKAYHMIDEDEPLLEKAIGTEIDWYPGKCLTQKILKKKPKKGAKNAKPITKTEDCESFFNFFNPPQVPDDDEDIDEERAEELQNLMEQDYDIGPQSYTRYITSSSLVIKGGRPHPNDGQQGERPPECKQQ
ncbi:unnamed protein product [Thlaspi arvense]|uniref:Nucleosome assembly protein 1 n=1 Tax=Thlaspi arvense TaxID=13288 RepID=A0AAU9SNQ7_THLAR|nr:unnamed protein product [Thlaspi arvense]